jgi:hypothetical protein
MANRLDESIIMYTELNEIGFTAGVTIKGLWENQENIYNYIQSDLMPPGIKLIVPDQVHGTEIIIYDGQRLPDSFEADGVLTNRTDACLTITTADCLPVIIADPSTGYFAAVHVGWRSFIGGIAENLFQIGRNLSLNMRETRVLIGPGIGKCCFEAGVDVAVLFNPCDVARRKGSCYVDLRSALRNEIELLGIAKANIKNLDDCTSCMENTYYSYRRDKDSPIQMVTFIYRTP